MEQQGLIILKQSISCFLSIPFHSALFFHIFHRLVQLVLLKCSKVVSAASATAPLWQGWD